MTHQTSKETRATRAASASPGRALDLMIPYYFSSIARDNNMDLRIGDYVNVRGLSDKFKLTAVFPRFGSVRVRRIGGGTEGLLFPWSAVTPWRKTKVIKSRSLTQLLGDLLFQGSLVYWLAQPDRGLLRVKANNWQRGSSDLEDAQGWIFHDIPWDSIEFAVDVECHFPDDE